MSHEIHTGEAKDGFRSAAVRAFAQRCERIDGQSTWRDLVEGRACIVDEFVTLDGSFLILLDRAAVPGSELSARNLEILEQVLLGVDQKVVAIERNLATSTVAACLRQAYDKIGLNCKPSRVSLLLVTLVHAAKGRGCMESGRASAFEYQGATFRVLRMTMPERVFDRVLSPAEEAVLRMRVQGRSHAEIAARRQTSLRTVANQVAAAFQRLGISSRQDLMELLIFSGSHAPTQARELRPRRPPSFPSRESRSAAHRASVQAEIADSY